VPLDQFDVTLDLEDLSIPQLVNQLIVVLQRAHVILLNLEEIVLYGNF
jgi:hypothetical protein